MSNPVGELLPEPDPDPLIIGKALNDARRELGVYSTKPDCPPSAREYEITLFEEKLIDEGTYKFGIEAFIYGRIAQRYLELIVDSDDRFKLEDRIERGVGRAAVRLALENPLFVAKKDAIALVSNVPVIFEPQNNAMLVGGWEGDWEKEKMKLVSHFVETRDQQLLLLGGFATLVVSLEQR